MFTIKYYNLHKGKLEIPRFPNIDANLINDNTFVTQKLIYCHKEIMQKISNGMRNIKH